MSEELTIEEPDTLMGRLLVDSLREQLAECRGDDVAANPSKWSHAAQIEGLRGRVIKAEQQVAMLQKELDLLRKSNDSSV